MAQHHSKAYLLTLALILPTFATAADKADHGGHDNGTAHHTARHPHHHGTVNVDDAAHAPRVALHVHPDSVGGWNLQLHTENFRFAPQRVNQANVLGEGHAHLYVGGKKIARLYGEWFHLPAQPKGRHEVKVTLHANQHEHYAVHGKHVQAIGEIVQQ